MDAKPPRTASPLPASIGRYRVVGRLGKGAMGLVYRAYDEVMDRPVAIKVMTADVQDDPDTSERFYREAHAAGQLVHPNIITIFDLGEEDGRPFIVMELLEGRTLADFLKRPEGVRIEEKISLMLQLCEGLQLAHSKGIYHRDIKPGNLLISDSGRLKIVDFGIARLSTSSMTMSGLIVGTPDYMSPEQACGREVDERSDIFSVGAVCYYMLTGRKPFAAPDLAAVLEKVESADPLPIRDAEAPPTLVAVVQRALAKSAAARYQKAAVMWADLLRIERELQFEARRVSHDVRADIEALAALTATRDTLCRDLGATASETNVVAYRDSLAARFPDVSEWLNNRGDQAWDWAAARERRREVSDLRKAFDAELASLTSAAADLRRGEAAVKAGDAVGALRCFDSALAAVPSSLRAQDQSALARERLGEQHAAGHRARTLVAEATHAADRSEWSTVLALTARALAADASNVSAAELRDRANAAVRDEALARSERCAKALERAEKLARKGRYDEAEAAVAEARQFDPDSTIVRTVETRIRSARLDAERASAAERRAAEIVATARALFDKGERAQAQATLGAFLAREPEALIVSTALAKFSAEADRLAADDRLRADAADLARAAEAALNADDPEGALTLARQALAAVRQEPLARQVERAAAARLRERALQQELNASVAQSLQNARALLARGKFDAARDLVRRATNLRPADEEAAALLATILGDETRAREAAAKAEVAQQRSRAVAPILEMARAAETSADFVRAGWLAENALALDVDCAEAKRIVEVARTKTAAPPAAGDDTVKLGATGEVMPGQDDTLTLRPAASTWQRLAETVGRRVSERLKARLLGRHRPKGGS